MSDPKRFGTAATVFLVADEAERRSRLRTTLESMGYAVDAFPSLASYNASPTADRIGCLLYDARSCAAVLASPAPPDDDAPPPIVYITDDDDVRLVVRALRARPADFLFRKSFSESDLWEAIEKALAAHVRLRVAAADRRERRQRLESLSDAERDVLKLLVAGQNNRKIAEELRLTVSTVEGRRLRLMKKLGVRHFPALVRFVIAAEA